jgi:hypothetical protein
MVEMIQKKLPLEERWTHHYAPHNTKHQVKNKLKKVGLFVYIKKVV